MRGSGDKKVLVLPSYDNRIHAIQARQLGKLDWHDQPHHVPFRYFLNLPRYGSFMPWLMYLYNNLMTTWYETTEG